MKALIIGGTKFIGKHITKELEDENYQITFFNRGLISKNQNTLIGDIENITSLKKTILSYNFDLVIHCICNTEKNAQDIIEIFENTNTRLIILSSQDCYHAFQELARGKNSVDYPINENSPLTDIKYYFSHINPLRAKYDKRLMENIFKEAFEIKKINFTIFRLPMVYGIDDYQFAHRHGDIIRRILDKKENYIMSYTKFHSIWTFLYVENLAKGIVFSLDKNITNGKIYNLSEEKVRTWKLWSDLYSKIANFNFNYKILPDEFLEEKKELSNSEPIHIITSSELFSKDTGYKEEIKIEDSIERTLFFASKNLELLPKIDYEKEESILNKYIKALNLIF